MLNYDAFSRFRISNPQTLFDSKQLFDNAPILYDAEVSGSGTSSTHSSNRASTIMGVTAPIDGTLDELVIAVRILDGSSPSVFGSVTVKELT